MKQVPKVPFYHKVIITKSIGGKRPLFNTRLRPDAQGEWIGDCSNVVGAGGSADLAIKDLAKQLRARQRNIASR